MVSGLLLGNLEAEVDFAAGVGHQTKSKKTGITTLPCQVALFINHFKAFKDNFILTTLSVF